MLGSGFAYFSGVEGFAPRADLRFGSRFLRDRMAEDGFDGYLSEKNEAYLRGDDGAYASAGVEGVRLWGAKTSGIVHLKRES